MVMLAFVFMRTSYIKTLPYVKGIIPKEKEPAAVRELHRIRQTMLAEEKRVGSEKFWAEVNRQGKEFARRHGLKYLETPSRLTVAREDRGKYKSR